MPGAHRAETLFATSSLTSPESPRLVSWHTKPAEAGIGQVTLFRDEEEEKQEGRRFSAITYLWHKGENVILEQHGIFSHLCPLTPEAAGEKSKALSESGDHSALLQNIVQLVPFLLTQPVRLPAATGETNPAGCLIGHRFEREVQVQEQLLSKG